MKTKQMFLDCETTGPWQGKPSRIIELAMVTRIIGSRGKVYSREPWERLFNPRQAVNPFVARKTHGLKDHHLACKPSIEAFLPLIAQRLGEADEVIAHNYGFDRDELEKEFSRAGRRFPVVKWVCSYRLAQAVLSVGSCSLSALKLHFKLSPRASHRALPDALSCEEIFDHCRKLQKKKGEPCV
jgi:DNA polymerase III epsilon subunit-like protein